MPNCAISYNSMAYPETSWNSSRKLQTKRLQNGHLHPWGKFQNVVQGISILQRSTAKRCNVVYCKDSTSQAQTATRTSRKGGEEGAGSGLTSIPGIRPMVEPAEGTGGGGVVGPPRRAPMQSRLLSRLLLTKPLKAIWAQESNHAGEVGGDGAAGSKRVLGLFDLVCIGVGGTLGSGVFVLTGEILSQQAGPSVALCWILSAAACALSGLSYMEMCSRVPSGGSCYTYSYVALGELPAVMAASLLSLEYGVSCSAVARSWADKLAQATHLPALQTHGDVSIVAGVITALSAGVLLRGLDLGKNTITLFTCLKVLLVLFMITIGFSHFSWSNMEPFIPSPEINEAGESVYGYGGVLRGTTMAFFGFIGFDEVCCMSGEARDPVRVMPRAVLTTISLTALLSCTAALALAAMLPHSTVAGLETYGFGPALRIIGQDWAATIVEAGELVTLSVVVLVSFLAQPHLQQAMARDGLLPPIFAKEDQNGILRWNLLLTGGALTVVSTVVPFNSLNDMIDAGVLLSLNMTNMCVILLRRNNPGVRAPSSSSSLPSRPSPSSLLALFTLLAAAAAFTATKLPTSPLQTTAASSLAILAAVTLVALAQLHPSQEEVVGTGAEAGEAMQRRGSVFLVPFDPYLPGLSIAINFYLVAQLPYSALMFLTVYLSLILIAYFSYGFTHSVGYRTGWDYQGISCIGEVDSASQEMQQLCRNVRSCEDEIDEDANL